MTRRTVIVLLLPWLAGFGAALPSTAFAWKLVAEGTPFVHGTSGYSIQFPDGWRWTKAPFTADTIATRDGPALQVIGVDFRKHRNAFAAIKQGSTPEMPPQELSQKLVADATARNALTNVEVLSDQPTTLGGRPAFRLHLAYTQTVGSGGLRYEEIVVGANSPQGLFVVRYAAPKLHYFERSLEPFEKALTTFVIDDKQRKR
jgi:hypothetical protein